MRWLIFWLAGLLICTAPAAACSVEKDYKVPTNFELVQKAKVIVLARVANVPKAYEEVREGDELRAVKLEPIRFLKGSAPTDSLRIMGAQPPKNFAGIPTVGSMQETHFSSGLGSCIRQFFLPGEVVVAMFDDDPKITKQIGQPVFELFEPFARVAESVTGDGDVWVRAVETYIALQGGDPTTIKDRMRAKLVELGAQKTIEAQAIAQDLDLQLNGKASREYWNAGTLPVIATALVPGHKEALLLCIAGTRPALAISSGGTNVMLVAGGKTWAARKVAATPEEKKLLEREEGLAVWRIDEPSAVLEALQSTADKVQVVKDGAILADALPADALLVWARQCRKLQSEPRPENF